MVDSMRKLLLNEGNAYRVDYDRKGFFPSPVNMGMFRQIQI